MAPLPPLMSNLTKIANPTGDDDTRPKLRRLIEEVVLRAVARSLGIVSRETSR
jgi:hypothetical protein